MNTASILVTAISCIVSASVADAATTFFYNDDAQCGYPFSTFQVKEITCAKSGTLYVDGQVQLTGEYYNEEQNGNNNNNNNNNYNYVNNNSNNGNDHQKEDGECEFGDDMVLTGSVTLDEAMYAQFDVKMKICFGDSTTSWYNSKKCTKQTTSIDMRPSTYQYSEENMYLQAGEHEFSASVTVPSKSFTFRQGYLVTAYATFYPKVNFVNLYQNGYNPYNNDVASYNYKTDCMATFSAGEDYDVQYGNAYGAAAVAALFLTAAGIAVQRRRRRLTSISTESMMKSSDLPEVEIIRQNGVTA